ncbi:MAG: heavy-metal-associated domain-containing protein, partial [Treponema sp.]|nr:heavy-metal-associated domain-containing protein [Treponema sp.]
MESDSLKTVTLKIRGMTCINCQNKIESALNNLAGVKSA